MTGNSTHGKLLLRSLILSSPVITGSIRSTLLTAFSKLPLNRGLSTTE